VSGLYCDPSRTGNLPLKTSLLRLQAELKHRADDATPHSVQYFKRTVSQLCELDGSRFADIRYNCLSDCVKALYAAGEYAFALDACKEMASIATKVDRVDWSRQADNFAGAMHAERGDLGEAVVCYRTSLETARRLKDISAEVSVLSNLGVAFTYGTLYREAIPCLTGAIERAEATGQGRQCLPALRCNLAQAYLATGELSRARSAINRSVNSDDAPYGAYGAHSRTIREWTFIDVALESGDLAAAKRHLPALDQQTSRSGSVVGRLLSKLSHGLINVHDGDVSSGLSALQTALAESMTMHSVHRSHAWTALIRAHELCGQPHDALRYMNLLMEDLSQRRRLQIASLLRNGGKGELTQDDGIELQTWKLWEARLRAAAAEHDVTNARLDMLERLAIASSLKEDPSGEHGYRVGRLAALLAEQLGWPRDVCFSVEIGARLHDIGKVGIPDRILLSSQPFQEAERLFMQSHTLMGAEILANSDVPQLTIAAEVARSHHERWDGRGYPCGLVAEQIPIHARIVTLADAFDALTHGRPYAPAMTIDSALHEIRQSAGRQFDPELAGRFVELVRLLHTRHRDLDAFLSRAALESPFLQARRKLTSLLQTKELGE
jgi:putative two-component system response regulator